MKIEAFFVKLTGLNHFQVWLVADNVINRLEIGDWKQGLNRIGCSRFDKSRQENPRVVLSLDKRVLHIAICCYSGHGDTAILVCFCPRLANRFCSTRNCLVINELAIIDCECNVLDGILFLGVTNTTMHHQVVAEILVARIQRRLKNKANAILGYNMRDNVSVPIFKTSVSARRESKASYVVSGSLFGISYPKGQVVESVVFACRCLCGCHVSMRV